MEDVSLRIHRITGFTGALPLTPNYLYSHQLQPLSFALHILGIKNQLHRFVSRGRAGDAISISSAISGGIACSAN